MLHLEIPSRFSVSSFLKSITDRIYFEQEAEAFTVHFLYATLVLSLKDLKSE